MTLKQELEELYEAKAMVESEVFQKYFARPMYKHLEELKGSYDCESLRELHTLKGRKQGLEMFTKILKKLPSDLSNKKHEYEEQS